MAEISYPVAGGGSVVDAAYEKLMSEISGSGFLGEPTQTPPMFADSTGRQIKLQPSRAALLHGFRWETDESGLTVPVAANTSGNPRMDLGVLRLARSDPGAWAVRFAIKQGSPAATPVAPAVTQSMSASSVWEIPVGTVKVVSTSTTQAGQGLPSIAPADVTPLEWYLAPGPLVTHSSRMPPVRRGQIVTQYDTGRVVAGLGSAFHTIGENGAWTNVPALAGFDNSNIWVRRVNGLVYFQALVYRNAPGVTTAAGTDLNIATIPAQFRPADGNIYLVGSHNEYHARFHISRSTGILNVISYPQMNLLDNHFFVVHPATWPAP